MTNTPASKVWFQVRAAQQIPMEQLRRVKRCNGSAAMSGILIGIPTEAITGSGMAHQIGLGPSGGWLRRLPHPVPALLPLSAQAGAAEHPAPRPRASALVQRNRVRQAGTVFCSSRPP
jgi:hypothetical protein